jgi:hypothetical protein
MRGHQGDETHLTAKEDALMDQAKEVSCEMEGCLKPEQDGQLRLRELPDEAIIKLEV